MLWRVRKLDFCNHVNCVKPGYCKKWVDKLTWNIFCLFLATYEIEIEELQKVFSSCPYWCVTKSSTFPRRKSRELSSKMKAPYLQQTFSRLLVVRILSPKPLTQNKEVCTEMGRHCLNCFSEPSSHMFCAKMPFNNHLFQREMSSRTTQIYIS